jgi:hypothetical protein
MASNTSRRIVFYTKLSLQVSFNQAGLCADDREKLNLFSFRYLTSLIKIPILPVTEGIRPTWQSSEL